MSQDNLRELFKLPGWQDYLDLVEQRILDLFKEMFQLDSTSPENFVKFVSLKAKIDSLQEMTHQIELVFFYNQPDKNDSVVVVESYTRRLTRMFKKLFGRRDEE